MEQPAHTEECWSMPDCTVCGRRKKPVGRDSATNDYCDSDCEGYRLEPHAGHFWPNEEPELRAAIQKASVQ